jgi:hypothetical protein
MGGGAVQRSHDSRQCSVGVGGLLKPSWAWCWHDFGTVLARDGTQRKVVTMCDQKTQLGQVTNLQKHPKCKCRQRLKTMGDR